MNYNLQFKSNWNKKLLLPAIALLFAACSKDDAPSVSHSKDPDIATNATIQDVKSRFTGAITPINDSMVFSGIVIGNDATKNMTHQLFLEDSTGGIKISVDNDDLNSSYPVGTRVFVKAKGMSVSGDGNVVVLGKASGDTITELPSASVSTTLIAGSDNHYVMPVSMNANKIRSVYAGMLVTIDSVEFFDNTVTYADKNVAGLTHIKLQDCGGDSLFVGTSSTASFADSTVQPGKGNVTGILVSNGNSNELLIRNLKDVGSMTATRCGEDGGIVSSIASLRSQYNGSDISFSTGSFTGIVVSNATNEANNNYKIVSEDNSAGIVLYQSGLNLNEGDKVTINISGAKLTTYNGDLELINTKSVTVTGTNATVTPKEETVANVISNALSYSTQLVTIKDLTIKQLSTSSTGIMYTLTSGDQSLQTFVRTTSGISLDNGVASVTGYISLYKSSSSNDTTIQLIIRSISDVVYSSKEESGSDDGQADATSLNADFSALTSGDNTTASGANNVWNGDDNFPDVVKAYQAGGMVKLGTGSAIGSLTTKALDLSGNGGSFTVTFDAKSWTSAGSIDVTTSDDESQSFAISNVQGDDMKTYTATFANGSKNTKVTITTVKGKTRAYVDNVKISTK